MNHEIFDRAIELTRQGVSVIATDVNKLPVTAWKPFQEHIATENELRAMFNKPNAQSIATIGGAVSGGLEILDFDNHAKAGTEGFFIGNVYQAWTELTKSQNPDLFQKLVINSTPSGGNHIRYRYKAETSEGNHKLAEAYELDSNGKVILDEHGRPKRLTLVETRGQGGYALCPPSPNYEMLQGDLFAIPTITKEERDFLIQTAKSFHVIQNDLRQPSKIPDEPRPGDDFNQRGDHRGLLEKHGWTFVVERNDGAELWRRPGKEDNGYSATWNAVPNRFYVFSTNASPLEAGRTYDIFALYAFLEHGGDFGSATKALGKEGYGTQKPKSKQVSAHKETKQPPKQPTAYVTEPIEESEIDTTPSISIPTLPETVWRGTFAQYRELMSPTSEASDAYHYAGFLTTVGALLGRSVTVYYAGPLYPNFYIVIEGHTGISRKSTAIRSSVKTIRDVDPTLIVRRGLSTVEGLINLLKAPTEEEMKEYEEKLEAFKKGLITQEPEQPTPIFEHEGRRLLVTLDEFALLLKKAKQESSSTLIQGLTEAYDCPPTLDNPTKERPMSAYKPCVSLIGLTTKAWLERSLDYDDLLGGFVNRFIFFVGEPKDPIPLPPEPNEQLWNKIKIDLNTVRRGNHNFALKERSPIQHSLSPEAELLWNNYYFAWHKRQKECDNEMMSCLYQRLPNHAMKAALIYATLEDKHGTRQITHEQLQAGIDLANYAEKSYEYLFHGFGFSRRSRVEATIIEKLSTQRMTKNELRRAISTAINTRELNEAILDLMKIGRLREASIHEKDAIGRKRRKSVLFLLK